ncbi:hypothetical protein KIN20_006994 [Parelaphostrongylus tenuis]|uniref:Programmed cell death protein 4 n=1 Tax=Parelaphostrongylus tenuis TaxID=148309 RepID=A0AAD5QHG6_PARTN|nr:hypothetical protein KIN20_006994 [Parelaphostrongylus tenuis]
MPYPTKYECDDDPEEIAEREMEERTKALEIVNQQSTSADQQQKDVTEPCPVKGPPARQVKEAKALRKQRNRGISGSSIKKDGGRFDYGLDDYEEYNHYGATQAIYDDEYDEEYENYPRAFHSFAHPVGTGSLDSNGGRRVFNGKVHRVRDQLIFLLSSGDGFSVLGVAGLLLDEHNDFDRVRLIRDAVNLICLEMDMLIPDSLYEYRLAVILSNLIHQGLLKSSDVSSFIESASESDHSVRLLNVANTVKVDKLEKEEQMLAVEKLSKKLVGNFDSTDVALQLSQPGVLLFHSHFVEKVCVEAIKTRNIDVIRGLTSALEKLVKTNVLDKTSVSVGFVRFFREVAAMEANFLGAASLAVLLTNYAAGECQIINDYAISRCPAPNRFLKANPQGDISVVDIDNKKCTAANYFTMGS